MLITTENEDQLRGDRNIKSLIQLLFAKLNKSCLLSIGDSHSRIFSNLDGVKIHHIGPVTAFNLVKENSSTKGREKLYDILDKNSSSEVAIILSFGEIDIRVHVIKTAIKDVISIKESAIRTAKQYCTTILDIVSRGFSVLIMGVHASGSTYDNQSYPAFGRVEDRNYAVKQFNLYLRNFCISHSIPYASLDSLVIDRNLKTNNEYMCDGCHLNLNLEIQTMLIYQFLISLDLTTTKYDHLRVSYYKHDVSENKPYILTSSYDGKLQGTVSRRDPYFFHTEKGPNQGILIDLQAKFLIESICIVNRVDCFYDRATSLCVVLFDMNDEIYRIDLPDDPVFMTSGGASIQIIITEYLMPSRVAVFSKANTYLHLAEINIYSCLPPMD